MRAAIYARYSSDLQRDTSLEDQVAVAKRYATERQWTVSNEHIYSDAGISGASIQNRPSVQRLLAAAGHKPKAFDVLLVDDSSRIARDIPDAIRVMQTLKFLGVRVIYISQGIDSDSEQADVRGRRLGRARSGEAVGPCSSLAHPCRVTQGSN